MQIAQRGFHHLSKIARLHISLYCFFFTSRYDTIQIVVQPDCLFMQADLERWQIERIATILDAEHAEQEAVHQEHDASPKHHRHLLTFRIRHARDLESERDGRERQDPI